MKKLCRKSGKVKFDSHEQAAVRAGEVLEKDHSKNTLYTYRCRDCGKWHMTSKQQRTT